MASGNQQGRTERAYFYFTRQREALARGVMRNKSLLWLILYQYWQGSLEARSSSGCAAHCRL